MSNATPAELVLVRHGESVGNLAASITVQQLGTTGVARPEEIMARFQESFG